MIRDRDKEIGKRNLVAVIQMGAVRETHILSTTENNGVIGGAMGLAGGASIETKRIVQQRTIAFLDRVELFDKVRV